MQRLRGEREHGMFKERKKKSIIYKVIVINPLWCWHKDRLYRLMEQN